jgi:hypothetical protein
MTFRFYWLKKQLPEQQSNSQLLTKKSYMWMEWVIYVGNFRFSDTLMFGVRHVAAHVYLHQRLIFTFRSIVLLKDYTVQLQTNKQLRFKWNMMFSLFLNTSFILTFTVALFRWPMLTRKCGLPYACTLVFKWPCLRFAVRVYAKL